MLARGRPASHYPEPAGWARARAGVGGEACGEGGTPRTGDVHMQEPCIIACSSQSCRLPGRWPPRVARAWTPPRSTRPWHRARPRTPPSRWRPTTAPSRRLCTLDLAVAQSPTLAALASRPNHVVNLLGICCIQHDVGVSTSRMWGNDEVMSLPLAACLPACGGRPRRAALPRIWFATTHHVCYTWSWATRPCKPDPIQPDPTWPDPIVRRDGRRPKFSLELKKQPDPTWLNPKIITKNPKPDQTRPDPTHTCDGSCAGHDFRPDNPTWPDPNPTQPDPWSGIMGAMPAGWTNE
jgi:hypothetical protein